MLVNCVATIMQRTKINDYCALYRPLKTTVGYFNDGLGVFVDAAGTGYLDIKSSFSNTTGLSYDNLVELTELQEGFHMPNGDLADTLEEYDDECKDFVVLAIADRATKKNISLIHLDTKQLVKIAEEFELDDINDQVSIITLLRQKYKYSEDFDCVLEEICDAVLSGKMSQEKLARVSKTLGYFTYKLLGVTRLINEELKLDELMEKKSGSDQVQQENVTEKRNSSKNANGIDIDETFEYVSGNVVGQDDAIYRLIVEIARAYDSDGEKNGILITGESGVGKTLAITSLEECLNRPVLIIDSTQLTMPGYVGKNVEEYLYDLYIKTGKNKELTESAIVYFDEIDKKGSERKNDVAGQGVLNTLLKFLDGTTYDASDCKTKPTETVKISTSNMLVIAGGAFGDVYKKDNSRTIGFGENTSSQEEEPSCDDFISKGMMTKEFMGRFPVVIHFKSLGKDDLLAVLTESNKSPLKREEKTFGNAGARLRVTPAYLEAVAQGALKLKTGARGLKRIVSDTTWRPYAKIKSDDSYGEVVLDADTVSDNKVYQLIKKDKND